MPKDQPPKNARDCSPSPYEIIPYRPCTRGEEDVIPLWKVKWPLDGQLRPYQCRTRYFDHFSDSWTIQSEIDIMRKIESGQYTWHDGFSDDPEELEAEELDAEELDAEEVEAQLFDDTSLEVREESRIILEPDAHEYSNYDDSPNFLQQENVHEIMQPQSPPPIVARTITPSPIAPVDPPRPVYPHSLPSASMHAPPATTTSVPSRIPRLVRPKVKHRNIEAANDVQSFRRRIRSTEFDIVWFVSYGNEVLPHPHPVEVATEGNIYLHKVLGGSPQMWMKTGEDTWLPVSVGVVHPLIPTHRLNLLSNGDPSWVTKKTVTTYRCRAKQRALPSMRPGI